MDVPFFRLLEGSAAARYSKCSTGFSNTSFKGGLSWKPIDDLRLRGTWAQGFRAPSIGELFGSPSRFDGAGGAVPEASSNYNASGVSATIRQNCAAQGVPATYVAANNGFPLITGGNRNLKLGKSEGWVLGGVYSPSWANDSAFARSISLEVDYNRITVGDAIASPDPPVLLNNCYYAERRAELRGDHPNGARRHRAGQRHPAEYRLIKSEGLDVVFNYRSPDIGIGPIGLASLNNFRFNFSTSLPSTSGTTTTQFAGRERGTGSPQAYPKFKSNTTLDLSTEVFSASVTARYISAVTKFTRPDQHRMYRILYLDAQLGLSPAFLDDSATFTLGVNNLLGKRAPNCLGCGSFDPTTYEMPDPFGYVRIAAKY